jgi:hypothetical protein
MLVEAMPLAGAVPKATALIMMASAILEHGVEVTTGGIPSGRGGRLPRDEPLEHFVVRPMNAAHMRARRC